MKINNAGLILKNIQSFSLLFVIVISPFFQGCIRVREDWKRANATRMSSTKVCGIGSLPEKPDQKYLVVQYDLLVDKNVLARPSWGPDFCTVYATIPLDHDMNPAAHFLYRGPLVHDSEELKSLSQEQKEALLNFHFTNQDLALGKRLVKNTRIDSKANKMDGLYCSSNITAYAYINNGLDKVPFKVIPCWRTDPILDRRVFIISSADPLVFFNYSDLSKQNGKLTAPDQCIIVPWEIQRPASDRLKAGLLAIPKLPVDFCLDIILPSIFVVGFMTDSNRNFR